MKKIILLFALLATATLYSQSIEGDWYLPTRNDFKIWSVKGDSIAIYDVAFDSVTNYNKGKRKMLSITRYEKNGNSTQIEVEESKTGRDKATLVMEVVTEKYPVAYIKIIKGKQSQQFERPLRFVTQEEIAGYAALKSLATLTKEDFIAFAKHITGLKEELPPSGIASTYLSIEMKYALVELGYNGLVTEKVMKDAFAKFKNDPETKELVEKLNQ